MKVRLSARAEGDLQSIFEYLFADSPRAAEKVTARLESACLELADRSHLYAILDRHPASGIRRRIVGAYGVFYLVKGDIVQVLAILHSARDYTRILFPDD